MRNYIKEAIEHNDKIVTYLGKRELLNWMSDETYLKLLYKATFKEKMNLDNPQTFNEKLQWLKLHNRNPEYTKMVDKYESKKYVSSLIGEKYTVPTYGIYDSFDEIDFDKLPDKFVIKCTHDSGGLVICKDKATFDKKKARKEINKCLKNNFYYFGREWPYKNVKPRIIIEKLLENTDKSELLEYNFFCFNGEPKLLLLCHGDKHTARHNDYYDMDFNKLNLKCIYPVSNNIEKKPKNFKKMVEISKKLSKNIPILRVDLYLCDGNIYVGELTFFHWNGFCKFEPKDWDIKLGKLIDLSNIKKK